MNVASIRSNAPASFMLLGPQILQVVALAQVPTVDRDELIRLVRLDPSGLAAEWRTNELLLRRIAKRLDIPPAFAHGKDSVFFAERELLRASARAKRDEPREASK